MIANRLESIRNADKIVVVDSGQVRQVGTHCELLATNGWYRSMAGIEPNQQQHLENSDKPIDSSQKVEIDSRRQFPLRRLVKRMLPDRWLVLAATIFAFTSGLAIPVYAYGFGKIMAITSVFEPKLIQTKVLTPVAIFLLLAICTALLNLLQVFGFF